MKKLVVLALPLVMASCGSDNGDSKKGSSSIIGASISSQFVDAPVKGMRVERSTSTQTFTGNNGMFTCANGEELIFKIGAAEIGRTNCSPWIHLFDLKTNDTPITHATAASWIQSLATGTEVLDLTAFNSTSSASTFDENSTVDQDFLDDLAIPGLTLVDETTARERAASNLKDLSNDPVFDKLVSATASAPVAVLLKGASTNNDEDCYKNVQLLLKIEERDMGDSKKAYQFKVTEYKAYDEATPPTGCESSYDYDCAENPLWKFATGRTISGSEYSKMSFSYKKGDPIACYDVVDQMYYLSEDTVEGKCEGVNDLPIKASKAQSFNLDFGMNYNLAITDSNIKIDYFEKNSNFEPVFSNENDPETATAYLKARPDASCSYSGNFAIE